METQRLLCRSRRFHVHRAIRAAAWRTPVRRDHRRRSELGRFCDATPRNLVLAYDVGVIMARVQKKAAASTAPTGLTAEQVEQWHALRMMIGFCREEAEALGADFLVYCLDLGLVAADDHMRALEAGSGPAVAEALSA